MISNLDIELILEKASLNCKLLSKLFPFVSFIGAFGSPMYKINLLAKVKDANIIRVTNGPKSTTRSSNKAYSFGNSTVDQLVTGDNFLTAIKGFNDNGYNEDITLSVIFKLNSEAIGKTNSIMSFTSATTDKNYLSIGLRSQENYANIVEGMDTG